ncbi:MAG: TolC family protein [Rhodocyclales bacterium]|nr:TolC family protein [Rhodocyclales bacterium]
MIEETDQAWPAQRHDCPPLTQPEGRSNYRRGGIALAIGLGMLVPVVHGADNRASESSKPSGVLTNAASAAAAAANAATAAANAATAAAGAASAALEAINAILPTSQRAPSLFRPPAAASSKSSEEAVQKSPATAEGVPTTESESSSEPTRNVGTRFLVPDEHSLVGLVGAFEIPVSVDTRGDVSDRVSGEQDLDGEPVNRAAETNLGESIGAGRGFSRETLAATARVDQAKAQSGQALALLLPSLALRRSSGREVSSPSVAHDANGKAIAKDAHRRDDTAVTLKQPLLDLPSFYDYGRRGVIEQARDNGRRAADGDAYLSSVNAYLALVSSRLQADMARDFEGQLKGLLAYVEKRASAGASSASDVARVRARNQAAISARLEQEAAHAAAGVEFLRLTNRAPRMARLPELDDLGAGTMPESLDRAVERAMESNPDIAVLISEVRAAEIDKSAARSRFLPRLDLELSDNKTLHAGGDPNPDGQRDKRAMLVLNWSLFSGGADVQYNRERSARHLELKYRLDDQRRRVVQTLSAQYATLSSSRERLTAGYRELKSIAMAAEAMSKRMLSGNQSLLDLLDVYDRYYQARVRLVNLHIQEMSSVAQIVRLVQGVPLLATATQTGGPATAPKPAARRVATEPLQLPSTSTVSGLASADRAPSAGLPVDRPEN